MEMKEKVGKTIANTCDVIATSRMIFEMVAKDKSARENLKEELEKLILAHKMRGEMTFADELERIARRAIDIDAEQNAATIRFVHLVRRLQKTARTVNGLWNSEKEIA